MDPNVLHNISYGMYIVSSFRDSGREINGQIVNTCFQITSDPVTIAVSINKENFTHGFIEESRHFSVSILSEAVPLNFIGRFGFRTGRKENKFNGVGYRKLESGCPVVLDWTVGYLELEIINKVDCLTHTLFIGRMIDSRIVKAEAPMTYDYYHNVKRGTTPKTAPTFIKEEGILMGGVKMQKYVCTVCGYVYDPSAGDPDNDVQPGTAFENLSDVWVCPVCGAEKSQFVKEG